VACPSNDRVAVLGREDELPLGRHQELQASVYGCDGIVKVGGAHMVMWSAFREPAETVTRFLTNSGAEHDLLPRAPAQLK